jgi:hypothetical protein
MNLYFNYAGENWTLPGENPRRDRCSRCEGSDCGRDSVEG